MDRTAAHEDDTKQVPQPDDCMTQLRILLDDFAVYKRRLRALHEQFLGLWHDTDMSNEQRRDAYRGILDTELAVLAEVQGIQQALDALLQEHRLHLRSGR